MEYSNQSDIVKDLSFGDEAKLKIMNGVIKLSDAVQSTLGASGACVIYEDASGKPIITKDGVTVAESIILADPVENMGATLIKEAARKTVKEVGDGTTTSTVLAKSLLEGILSSKKNYREIKKGIDSGFVKVNDYLESVSVKVTDDKLHDIASISCNNDSELGGVIADAFLEAGKDGVVLVEDSEDEKTYIDSVDGCQFESPLKSPYFATNKERGTSELENPLVLISSSPIANIRSLMNVMQYVTNNKRPLLIIGEVELDVLNALKLNHVKKNITVNVISSHGFAGTKRDAMDELGMLTGAKVINEELGDDMDMITPDMLGSVEKSITNDTHTILTVSKEGLDLKERIDSIKKEIEDSTNDFMKGKLQERLGVLSGKVSVIKIGAGSEVELKEKKDRVEDSVHAVRAALKGGIVSGGGIALKDALGCLDLSIEGEKALSHALISPYKAICKNAGIDCDEKHLEGEEKGVGINVITGEKVNMIDNKVIDPLLVTKTALKNAISVASTISSASCVINNVRA